MEITTEQLYQEIISIKQDFRQELKREIKQDLQEIKESIIRWVVGIFLGGLLLMLSALGLYTSTLIGLANMGMFK